MGMACSRCTTLENEAVVVDAVPDVIAAQLFGSGRPSISIERCVTTLDDSVIAREHVQDDAVNVLLERAAKTDAGFDAFALDRATGGRVLSTLAYHLVCDSGVVAHMGIGRMHFAMFLIEVEQQYNDSNTYHNRNHAACVVHMIHHILRKCPGLLHNDSDGIVEFACYFAAIVHDMGHLGVTNDHLVSTGHELAIRYNDASPMENHHLALAFDMLLRFRFVKMSPMQYKRFRTLVIDLVLSTDMKSHFTVVGDIWKRPNALLCVALKCADLAHTTYEWELHSKWVSLLQDELFMQGDCERMLGMEVSAMFDRAGPGVSLGQEAFFRIFVVPMMDKFTKVFPDASGLFKGAKLNMKKWKEQ